MTTICNFPDIDIYLLYYLDIKSVIRLSAISKDQHTLLSNLDFIRELHLLKNTLGTQQKNTINYASQYNFISILQWMHDSSNEFLYTDNAIDFAALHGHVSVLNWFDKMSDIYEFKYSKYAINWASSKAHIEILEWFDKSKYEFKYDIHAIKNAVMNGHTSILDWFDKSKYEFKYDEMIINFCIVQYQH